MSMTNTIFKKSAAGSAAQEIPLSMVRPEKQVQITHIHGKPDVRRLLNHLGFAEHAAVRVISELDGNVIVSVKGARVAISKIMAACIYTV